MNSDYRHYYRLNINAAAIMQHEPVWLKKIRFGTQAICLESIVPQNVLMQHILLPDNGEIIDILKKNNSIFPPSTCIDPAKSE